MNSTHVTMGAQSALEANLGAYRSANLLKNPDFANLWEHWTQQGSILRTEPTYRLNLFESKPGVDASLSQTVEDLRDGRYLVAFVYKGFSAKPDARLKVRLGDEELASFIVEKTEGEFRHCFVVVDLKAVPSPTLQLYKPSNGQLLPGVSEVWLVRTGDVPTRPLLRNGDFSEGASYWTLDGLAEVPLDTPPPHGLQLSLGSTAVEEAWAEQAIVWPDGAVPPANGTYVLVFSLYARFPIGHPEPRDGEVQVRVGGVLRESLAFEHIGPDPVLQRFVLDLSSEEFGAGVDLRIVKLRNDGVYFQHWWVDHVSLTLFPMA